MYLNQNFNKLFEIYELKIIVLKMNLQKYIKTDKY